MSRWLLVLLSMGLLNAVIGAALPGRSKDTWKDSKMVQVCGSNLANVLSLVCQPYGGLNGPSSAASSSAYVQPGVRHVGIVDECCRRPCSWRTLLSYCANYTSEEEPQSEASERGEHEEELDNRLIDMLFGPPTPPKRPRRFGKPRGCMRRCKCDKRPSLQLDEEMEGNRRANDLNALGTVAPELGRKPVVVYRHF